MSLVIGLHQRLLPVTGALKPIHIPPFSLPQERRQKNHRHEPIAPAVPPTRRRAR